MSERERLVRVEVRGLMHDPATRAPIVVLRDEAKERFLPIWIGMFEAQAIALTLEGITPQRPMTHDLLVALVSSLGATIERVVVSALREGTYFGVIEALRDEETVVLDARPSDAIAVALRCGCPVFVHEDVFEAARTDEGSGTRPPSTEEDQMRKLLESLSPEDLGKYKM